MGRRKFSSLIAVLLFLSVHTIYAQQLPCKNTLEESLKQAAKIFNDQKAKKIWDVSLDAPIIIIDHVENKMYFTAIGGGKVQAIRKEQWNNTVPLANSFFEYKGKRYVTIVYAALMNITCEERINLLAHEIFHLHQNSLGIENTISANYHMDEVYGRALLRVEMQILQQVLDGDMQRLYDALYIREYRQSLYPDNNEDLYELNEGLAEYTGVRLSAANPCEYIKSQLNYNIKRGYTNAFGYFTGSAYAFILDELFPQWKTDMDLSKGMIYLIKKTYPEYVITINDTYLSELLTRYNYDKKLLDEKEELKSFGDITHFEDLLKSETPKFCITNNRVNFTYNPHDRVIALTNAVLLRNMTVTGEWGQINVRSGIVRRNDWSAFYLLPPNKIDTDSAEGDNYTIQINQGWKMAEKNGIYEIIKE